ncbi:MAG: glycosyltransferase family 39 protein [Oscillospiraceae bacterium]|nr:glycosyltransferase family 39 protein [Oscillospiraceae bacterium]
MRRTRLPDLIDRHEWLLAGLLLVLGCALRLTLCGALPVGLNQDEASAGYDAWAILHYGIDRCGKSWPVLLTAWGSGQNALMSYLAMPGIALFGLSAFTTRLPNALAGCLTLWVFWRLARRVRGPRFALTALLVLSLNPWHIMMSRWGLESNLLPCFLLLGLYFTVLAAERPRLLVAAAACFALSLYAYGTAFFLLPLLMPCLLIWLGRRLRWKPTLLALGVFVLLALPITAAQAISALGWEETVIFGVTLPRLSESRQAATSVLGGGGLRAVWGNLKNLLRLLWTQSDGLIWNALPLRQGGLFYFFGLPLAVVGIVCSIRQRKNVSDELPLLLSLGCGLACALLIDGNVNRLNFLWLPLLWFCAVGLHAILARLGSWAALPILGLLACCCFFCSSYVRSLGGRGNVNFFPGLEESLRFADTLDAETVYITPTVNQPYIFALFYEQVPPDTFVESVEYRDENAAFRDVLRFEGFEFADPTKADVRIVWRGYEEDGEVLARYGCFAVCR